MIRLYPTRLWNDADIESHALCTEAIHAHGSLAAVELWHGGAAVMNRTSLDPVTLGRTWAATHVGFMGQLRPKAMEQADIDSVLHWQRLATRRALDAGFDIIYVMQVWAIWGMSFLARVQLARRCLRGSLENRVRFVREMLEVTREEAVTKPQSLSNQFRGTESEAS